MALPNFSGSLGSLLNPGTPTATVETQYQNADGSYKPGYEYMAMSGAPTGGSGETSGFAQGWTPGTPPATYASSPGTMSTGGSPYDSQINALYQSVGKTPDMIDQQGRDYWTQRLANGEDITGAFQNSAKQVYANMDTPAGKASPNYQNNVYGRDYLERKDQNAAFDAVMAQHAQQAAQQPAQQQPQSSMQPISMPMTEYQASYGSQPAAPVSSSGLGAYNQNPYMKQMGTDLQSQFNQNLTQSTLPALRGGALAAGGIGGSRQGIAEGLAAGQSNTGAASAITSMFGQDYNNQMNRNLQQYQGDQQFALGNRNVDLGYGNLALGNKNADNSYNLGQGNLALGNKQADYGYNLGLGSQALTGQGQMLNFYDSQRTGDRADALAGATIFNMGQQGPWNTLTSANGLANPYVANGTTTANSTTGGGTMGAIGGLGSGAVLAHQMGWL